MNSNQKIHTMVLSALLIAIGIIIPMISPLKVIIEPASFTLASHVAIIIAMFVSPTVAISVALGTTLGFFLGGFPITVVLRALSHVIWALAGSLYLKKYPDTFMKKKNSLFFISWIALLHAIGEVIVVTPLFAGGILSPSYVYSILVLVGVGTIVHSTVDFVLSLIVWRVMTNVKSVTRISNIKKINVMKTA